MKILKVPEKQYREATLQIKGEGDKRSLEMSISSDVPYLRYDWWNDEEYYEILSHAPGDIDDSRLKAGLPILFNHDRNFHLGRAKDFENDGHSINLKNLVRTGGEASAQKWADMESGVLVDTSVGYTVDSEGVCVGEKDGIPIYKFKWQPFEGSPVTVPADFTVGVGRQRGHEMAERGELGKPREIRIREKDDSQKENTVDKNANETQKRGKQAASPKENPMPEESDSEKTARLKREKQERDAILSGIRAREKELGAIIARGAKDASGNSLIPQREIEKATEAIEDPETGAEAVHAFRQLVFEKYFGNPTSVQTPREGSQQSTAGGAAAPANGNNSRAIVRSPGALFSADEEELRTLRGKVRGLGSYNRSMQIPDITRFRATLTTGTGSANLIDIQDLTDVVVVLQQRLTIADLCGQGTTNRDAIRYPQQTNYVNTVATVAEGAAKPEVTFRFETKLAPVTKIAGWTKMSEEVISDFPMLKSIIDAQLPFMVQQREEDQLLNGDGTGENLTGLLNTQNILTQAVGADPAPDAIFKAITKVRTVAFLEPDGVVINSTDWMNFRLMKDENGQYYAGGPFTGAYGQGMMQIERIWGLPVVVTTAIAQGTALVGAFKIATMVARRTGITVDMTNSDVDDFQKNLVTIRAEERVALLVWRPQGLCEVTGLPA